MHHTKKINFENIVPIRPWTQQRFIRQDVEIMARLMILYTQGTQSMKISQLKLK